MRCGVGSSTNPSTTTAARAAAKQALVALQGEPADAVLLFAAAEHDQQQLLQTVRQVVGSQATIVGCSGEGVITQSQASERCYAVAVMAIRGERLRFESFSASGYGSNTASCVSELAANLARAVRDDTRLLMLFADGLSGDCTALLQALEGAGVTVPVIGGTAGDSMTMTATYQYHDDQVMQGGVTALLLGGDAEARVAVAHGCTPIGLRRTVTRAAGGWIYEIDGLPAWEVFREYLDGEPTDLNADGIIHLCVGEPLDEPRAREYSDYVIRTPMKLDGDSGALFFPGGGLTEGTTVQMTRRDQDEIKRSARRCAESLSDTSHKPALVLQVDCAGRGRALFGSCFGRDVVEPMQQAIGQDVPWIGFNSYGEIAPLGGRPYFHNYTVALLALFETPAP
ncbi:MAG: FIST C-terminal domain-containing protein [Myxococcales bacterium]|nr:FIST C-terminal domain-containing protein [Myxococcales bacterium]